MIVGDDQAGAGGQRGEQALAGADGRLDVRVIGDAGGGEAGGVVTHAGEHEGVQAVAGPRVIAAQGLEHEQGPGERAGAGDRVVEREAPRTSPRGGHPVAHELAVGARRYGVGGGDPERGDGHVVASDRGVPGDRSGDAGQASRRGEVGGQATEAHGDDAVPVALAGASGEAVERGHAGAGAVEAGEGATQQRGGEGGTLVGDRQQVGQLLAEQVAAQLPADARAGGGLALLGRGWWRSGRATRSRAATSARLSSSGGPWVR